MSRDGRLVHISERRVVYRVKDMDDVDVLRDIVYNRDGAGPLTLDLYLPPRSPGETRPPLAVIVAGFPDEGFEERVGRRRGRVHEPRARARR